MRAQDFRCGGGGGGRGVHLEMWYYFELVLKGMRSGKGSNRLHKNEFFLLSENCIFLFIFNA